MRHVRLTLIAAVLAFAGCGAEEERPAPTRAAATATAKPDTGPPLRSIKFDLRGHPNSWPALPGATLRLPSSDPATAELVYKVGPPTRVEAEIVLPARGRAGVFCGRYAVAVAADGDYALYRDSKPVLEGRVEPGGRSDPGEATLVRLLCDEGSIGFMINASPISFARDTAAGDDDRAGRVGAFGIGPGDDVRYLAFAASESAK